MSVPRVTLRNTQFEYLLSIHASQKERAKQIAGSKWDPQRKCWVYPRNSRVYNTIVGEFGEELNDHTDTANKSDSSVKRESLTTVEVSLASVAEGLQESSTRSQSNVDPLQARFDAQVAISNRYQLELKQSRASRDSLTEELLAARREIQQLQKHLVAQRNGPELTSLMKHVEETEARLVEQRAKAEKNNASVLSLESELQAMRQEIAQFKSMIQNTTPNTSAQKFLIKYALVAADGDKQFGEIIRNQGFNAQLALTLHNELVSAVAALLPEGVRSDNLHKLLVQVREQEILADDQLDLAHIIRRQRNIIAHTKLSKSSTIARVLLALFAAALLWPDLSKKS